MIISQIHTNQLVLAVKVNANSKGIISIYAINYNGVLTKSLDLNYQLGATFTLMLSLQLAGLWRNIGAGINTGWRSTLLRR